MQDEKEMVREEENETPEAPDQEEALKQSEADTETEQEEAAEADKKPRKEKSCSRKIARRSWKRRSLSWNRRLPIRRMRITRRMRTRKT